MSESIAGVKFGRLTVIKVSGRTSDNRPAWLCVCDCGKEAIVSEHNLKRGNTKSCGCFKRDKQLETHYEHGLCGTRLYRGRGISYAPEWKKFSCFSKWALANGYRDGLELDRIDTDGNYIPENCRFVTHQTNCQNRRKKHG